MTPDDVRKALRSLPGFLDSSSAKIEALTGGWSSHAFTIDPDWIVRFPRNERAAAGIAKERRLLPIIADAVSFEVPFLEHVGEHAGLPFSVHRRVPGRPFTRQDADANALAGMLADLHAVEASAVASALRGPDGQESDWRSHYESLEQEIAERVVPLLEDPLATRVEQGIRRFLENDLDSAGPVRLVHGDLGADHILVDPVTSEIIGMIDFESAALGDPAIDLVGIRISSDASVVRATIRQHPDLDDAAFSRLDFYAWMGSVHAILHGLDETEPRVVSAGLTGLGQRIGWKVDE